MYVCVCACVCVCLCVFEFVYLDVSNCTSTATLNHYLCYTTRCTGLGVKGVGCKKLVWAEGA